MSVQKVALIGANGQFGSDIAKVFQKDSTYELFPLTKNEIDVTQPDQVKEVLERIAPSIVINTAAYHKVDEVEDNSAKAFEVNATAEKNLAEICQEKGIVLTFISTDYVFGLDEKRTLPYVETDPTAPVNVYGVSKVAGESVTRYISRKHFVVRVCGLFGVSGAAGKGGNFIETMIRLGKERGVVKVVNDQVLTPTYTKNIAENMAELLKTDNYGLYHLTAEGQCSWWEFAGKIFKLTKMDVKCDPVSSTEFPTRAKRPHYSVLENAALKKLGLGKMRPWEENLELYLKEKGYLQ